MEKKRFAIWLVTFMLIFTSVLIYASYEKINRQSDTKRAMKETLTKAAPAAAEVRAAVAKAEQEAKEKEKREQEERYFDGLSAYIRHVNRNVTSAEADAMVECFVKYGEKYNVDEKVVMAIAQNESTYYADAVSCEDYKGLMQTGDGLARNAGYDPGQLFNPEVSIKVGARYLSIKMDEFGDLRLALTAYNQGSGSVHSGNYSTGYADLAIERTAAMEHFLANRGYI